MARPGTDRLTRALLGCGLAAALLYVGMMLVVGLLWDGYSLASQSISELSALDAPTRSIWMILGTIYSALIIVFGWSVWKSASNNRAQSLLGMVLIASGVFAYFWPPMHQRAVLAAGGATATDMLHIAWATGTGIFFLVETGFGSAALGGRFRIYSIVTLLIGFACAAITATYTSAMQANLPTPGLGIWERISAGAYMAWLAVLAVALRRKRE
jgi:hypothetical membrane protein